MIQTKNKKGSHVGMILSFTIFIGAIIFAYSIIGSPFKVSTTKADSIDLLKINLLNELSQDIIVARIYDNSNPCVQFETPKNSFSSPELISVKVDGGEVDSIISGGDTLVSGGKGFVKVYYLENGFAQTLDAPGVGCSTIEPKSISHEKIITEQAILDTIGRVKNDYDNLTRDLRVSSEDEINILFSYSGGEIGEKGREVRTDVYARRYDVTYLSKEGILETGGLIVSLW